MGKSLPEGIRLQKLCSEIECQERVVALVARSLSDPIFYRSAQGHLGFRFLEPDWRHFCLLKATRAVSGLNACVCLLRGGFTQELAVVVRTIVECTTHIEFVLAGLADHKLAPEQDRLVAAFFADFKRDQVEDFGRPKVKQRHVHKEVGAHTDELVRRVDANGIYADVDTSKLMSNVYLTFSNYVHCRYPETMDLFGGDPLRLHLSGMRGIPKDTENVEILESFVITVSHCLRFVVLHLGLIDTIMEDADLAAWYPPQAA